MDKLFKWIERILQIVTIISGIWATVEMIRTYLYKRKLKEKADTYLDEELELEGNIRGPVAVYSPKLKEQENRVKKLLAITGAGCISIIVLNLINRDRY